MLDVVRLLDVAANVADGWIGAAALRMGAGKAAGQIFLRWRECIHWRWMQASRVILADATTEDTITRQWLPGLHVPGVASVAAPHMRVVQIVDRAFGYGSVVPGSSLRGNAYAPAASNARMLGQIIVELATRYGGRGGPAGPDVLVIMPKTLEEHLHGQPRAVPANVATAHFGNLRGLDAYKDVGALMIVSRPLPPPSVVEDEAELIFGPGVARLPAGSFYPKRPAYLTMIGGARHAIGGGGQCYHPDPRAEAVRRAHCEAELIQAIGRGAGHGGPRPPRSTCSS